MRSDSSVKLSAYAVVRIDLFQDQTVEWANRIKVTKVVMDQQSAEAEVQRLGRLNTDKEVKYFWQKTHLEQHKEGSGGKE